MDKLLVQKARQSDLPKYLLSRGEKLKKDGRRYRHAEHESLVFTENAYYWNARGEYGNSVDFLMSFYGMDFKKAVIELVGEETREQGVSSELLNGQTFTFEDLKLMRDMRRAVAYLSKTRSIDYSVIKNLINKKYIFQEIGTNNIVFVIYDQNRKPVGAELHGTLSDKRFKGIQEGSKSGYGFNIPVSEPLKYALFFESAIDLISFMEIEKIKGKPLTGCLLVSMAGIKENIVKNTLTAFRRFTGELQPVLCVDRDIAGENFVDRLKVQIKGIEEHLPDLLYKDWNEQLKNTKSMIKENKDLYI